MTVILHGVQPEELETIFPLAAPLIYRIPLLNCQYKLDDVYKELKSESWQLWLMMDKTIDGVLLTEILDYPLCRVLVLKGISGRRMHRWIKFLDVIEEYARDNGCSKIMTAGARRGWRKILADYKHTMVVLEKEL